MRSKLLRSLCHVFVCASMAAAVGPLGAQAPRDSATCRAILNAPTQDSAVARIGLTVRPFDTIAVHMSASYRDLVAMGVRQFFKAPQPLALRTYGSEIALAASDGSTAPKYTTLSLSGTYRA